MDPNNLLEVPLVSNPAYSSIAQDRGMTQGHVIEYKSTYLDTLPDNKGPMLRSAPWPATPRFIANDARNQNAKYDDPDLGTKPQSLPYARLTSTGLRAPGTFPKDPHAKDPIDGAQVVVKPHMPALPWILLKQDRVYCRQQCLSALIPA